MIFLHRPLITKTAPIAGPVPGAGPMLFLPPCLFSWEMSLSTVSRSALPSQSSSKQKHSKLSSTGSAGATNLGKIVRDLLFFAGKIYSAGGDIRATLRTQPMHKRLNILQLAVTAPSRRLRGHRDSLDSPHRLTLSCCKAIKPSERNLLNFTWKTLYLFVVVDCLHMFILEMCWLCHRSK